MPFGIPPSHDRAVAAGDYAFASEKEVSELAQAVLAPVLAQIEAVENAVGMAVKRVKRSVSRTATMQSNAVGDIADSLADMLTYVSTDIQSYVNSLNAVVQDSATQVGGAATHSTTHDVPSSDPDDKPSKPQTATQKAAPFCPLRHVEDERPEQPVYTPPAPPRQSTTFPCPRFPESIVGLVRHDGK